MGEQGSAAYDGQDVFRQAAVPVEVIDTLGVGDAFIGAFLAQYVVNSSVPSSLKHAAEYSAHYCTVEGAF
jgi:sugar/nucleoside kinase (ribokinase family)